MSANNFDDLDNEFNIEMFSTEDQRYDVEDDNLLLSDPDLEHQFNNDSAVPNEQEDTQTTEAQPGQLEKKKKKKRRRNRNDQFELAVIGDSNLKGCDQYLDGILFKLATKWKNGQHRLTHALNEITQLKNIRTIVISALQNLINDQGIQHWSETVTNFVLRIATFATKRSDVEFVVLAPFLRVKRENHGPLLKPITQQMMREFSAVPNVRVFDGFSASVEDLKPDGVHLNKQGQERLFEVVQQCLQTDWTLSQNSRQAEVAQQVRSGARSEFPDLRQFLDHRNAPLMPAARSRSRSPRYNSQNPNIQSLAQYRSRSPRQQLRRSPSPVRYRSRSRPQRSNHERHHSGPVRRYQSRSQSPVINEIARLDQAHLRVFGRYPDMQDYFLHRLNNVRQPPRSVSGPNGMQPSIGHQPRRPPSGPGRRQLSNNDLRHRLNPHY